MTDDRSLERAARSWLEIGPIEAPDRAIEAALLRIDTTPQERDWHVPWRLPKMTTPVRFATAAIVGVFVIGGALYTFAPGVAGPGAPSPMPTTIVSAAPTQASIEAYRAARDQLCIDLRFPAGQLHPRLLLVWDGSITAVQRADWIDALRTYVGLYDELIGDLGGLEPPAELAEGHATNVSDFRTLRAAIANTADHLEAGEDAQAQAADEATNPIGQRVEQWETDNSLAICP